MERPICQAKDRQELRLPEVPDFEEFFETHRRRLLGAMCLVTGNRSEAEEITQDAFIPVWELWDRVSTLDDPLMASRILALPSSDVGPPTFNTSP